MKPFHKKYFLFLGAAVLAAAGGGCATASADPQPGLVPRLLVEVERPAPAAPARLQPTVALVLGGGGLRGFAHIGVLKALEEAGIKPGIVVGTSAGAVVGAAYASGMAPAQIDAAARSIKLSSLVDWTVSSGGVMRGKNLARWVDAVTGGVPIEEFPRRFGAVATDLQSAKPVLLDRGPAGNAIQASAAVPGVTVPVAYANGHLVDGGVAALVPVRFARAMGGDVVIAVDIFCRGPRSESLAAPAVVHRVMHAQSCLVAGPEMAEADVLIAPAVRAPGISAAGEQDAAIEAGYQAARAALPRIMAAAGRTKGRVARLAPRDPAGA